MARGLPYELIDGWYRCRWDNLCRAETETLRGMELHLFVCHGARRADKLEKKPSDAMKPGDDLPRKL
jgi:hypothetical protein